MFRDETDWERLDRWHEKADGCPNCERHLSACVCNVHRLPARLRVAAPLPELAGVVVQFPTTYRNATAPGYEPDAAA